MRTIILKFILLVCLCVPAALEIQAQTKSGEAIASLRRTLHSVSSIQTRIRVQIPDENPMVFEFASDPKGYFFIGPDQGLLIRNGKRIEIDKNGKLIMLSEVEEHASLKAQADTTLFHFPDLNLDYSVTFEDSSKIVLEATEKNAYSRTIQMVIDKKIWFPMEFRYQVEDQESSGFEESTAFVFFQDTRINEPLPDSRFDEHQFLDIRNGQTVPAEPYKEFRIITLTH